MFFIFLCTTSLKNLDSPKSNHYLDYFNYYLDLC